MHHVFVGVLGVRHSKFVGVIGPHMVLAPLLYYRDVTCQQYLPLRRVVDVLWGLVGEPRQGFVVVSLIFAVAIIAFVIRIMRCPAIGFSCSTVCRALVLSERPAADPSIK